MLILVEGPPGAGKSTTARALQDAFADLGRPVRWWHEEEIGHPVYLFRDDDSLRKCIVDLREGRHEQVVADALAQWRRFADSLRDDETTVVLDGCLTIYLTYSLLFIDVPEAEIAAYLDEVARIIAPCDPRLVLLRPSDLTRNLADVCAARGDRWSRQFEERIEASPYGQHHGLAGFDGAVEFWAVHRELTDRLLDALSFPAVVVPGPVEDWPATRTALSDVLSIPIATPEADADHLQSFAGRYVEQADVAGLTVDLVAESDSLVLLGLTGYGDRVRLVPRGPHTFGLEGFPRDLMFHPNAHGQPIEMTLAGRDLLFGRSGAPRAFTRIASAPSTTAPRPRVP